MPIVSNVINILVRGNVVKINLQSLVGVFFIFVAHFVLRPMGDGYVLLNEDEVALVSSVESRSLKTGLRRDSQTGCIIVTPSSGGNGLRFSLSDNMEILLAFRLFSVLDDVTIDFSIIKNGRPVQRAEVGVSKVSRVILAVEPGDEIQVLTDSSKAMACLKLYFQEPYFNLKNIAIPFLWGLILVIFFRLHSVPIFISGYLLFLVYSTADSLNFGALGFNSVVGYLLLAMSYSLLLMSILACSKASGWSLGGLMLSLLVCILTAIIPISFLVYLLSQQVPLMEDALYAIFQSNVDESFEYIVDYVGGQWLLFVFAFFFLAVRLFYIQLSRPKFYISQKSNAAIFIVLTLSLVFLFGDLKLFSFLIDSARKYATELALFKAVQEKRSSGEIQFSAIKKERDETYVVIIGESANKRHMGLYGYARNTTPFLSELNKNDELVVYENAYSSHTHTVEVLSLSLTEATQLNGLSYYNSLSILNVLAESGVETYWITNQALRGPWDNAVSVLAEEADHLIAFNHSIGMQSTTRAHDGEVLPRLEEVLASDSTRARVIFVHLMGSHSSYCARFPQKEYSLFDGALDAVYFGQAAGDADRSERVNCYDNSILYGDKVVSSIISLLQQKPGVAGLMYLSDHADDVLTARGHESSLFTYEMTQIPMLAWVSSAYKERYPARYQNVKRQKTKLFPNDFLYDTLLGFTNVQTSRYQAANDITDLGYTFDENEALTLHGKKRYTGADNYIWWQSSNSKFLTQNAYSGRVFPHRINSIGKLKEIYAEGFRALEVDVRFGDHGLDAFRVGHNVGDQGAGLDDFLSTLDGAEIKRLWLDFKNLSEDNYLAVLDRLSYLDRKFGIKENAIVEFGATKGFVKELSRAGWHMSYYMPTDKILMLESDNDKAGLRHLAKQISLQIRLQMAPAISFDQRLYGFVKNHLEALIDEDIVYHVWGGPGLYRSDFTEVLQQSVLFKDQRIKSILVGYFSRLHL